MSDEVLAWLSVCSKLQMFAHVPADTTATPSSLASLKSRTVYGRGFLVLAYPGCPGKKASKRVLFRILVQLKIEICSGSLQKN